MSGQFDQIPIEWRTPPPWYRVPSAAVHEGIRDLILDGHPSSLAVAEMLMGDFPEYYCKNILMIGLRIAQRDAGVWP